MARHRRPAHSVAAAYDIASDGSIGFALGQYDPAFALTIDPILTYSTYLGSGTGLDQPFDIAVDTNGKAYIAGATESSLFPPVNYYDNTYNGGCDAFVASFDLNTTGIGSFVYSSYFGGSSTDQAEGIAVNTSGSSAWVSITGWTYSSDFPVPGAAPLQIGLSGPGDAFVARFYPVDGGHLNLTPAYSAYLGGSAYD